jgi:DNA-binding NarL/FixJ family response regulator
MSDEPKPNKGELIPSINRSLARKESGLVKRGLELIHEFKKQPVLVQIGNNETSFTDLFSYLIKEVIKDKYDLILGSSDSGQELIKLAKKGKIDILILVIENIYFSGCHSFEDRLVNILRLITQFKMAYGRPVIALSAFTEKDCPVIARVKLAADFYFQMPYEADAFQEAFEKCLEMLQSLDEVPRKRLEGSARHTTT